MRRIMIGVLALLCSVLFLSTAFAAEKEETPRFNPSMSAGWALSDNFDLTLASPTGILGARVLELDIPGFSGAYVAGELPFMVTDRLKVALEGRFAASVSDEVMSEQYNTDVPAPVVPHRDWKPDDRQWVTANFLVSYAFLKNVSFLKEASGVVGFRWDYQNMHFGNAHAPFGILSAPGDRIEFGMHTFKPLLGLTMTLKGWKCGIFGGDIKLGAMGSPWAWGNVDYNERFGGLAFLRFDGDLDRGSFWEVFGDVTAISWRLSSGVDVSLSMFGKYAEHFATGGVDGKGAFFGGPITSGVPFDFRTSPNLAVVGLKAAAAF